MDDKLTFINSCIDQHLQTLNHSKLSPNRLQLIALNATVKTTHTMLLNNQKGFAAVRFTVSLH